MTENAPTSKSNTAWPWDSHPLAIFYARVPDNYSINDSLEVMSKLEPNNIQGASLKLCFDASKNMILCIEGESVQAAIDFGTYFRDYGVSLTLNGPVTMEWVVFTTHLLLLDQCVTLIKHASSLLRKSMTPDRRQKFIELYQGLYCALPHSPDMQWSIRNLNLPLQLGNIDPPAEMPAPWLGDLKDGIINLLKDIDPNWRLVKEESTT